LQLTVKLRLTQYCMPATVPFLECKSYVIVGIYTSISEFPLMCGDVRFPGTPQFILW